MDRPPEEPSADMRKFARLMRDMYAALSAEGFSKSESLIMIGQVISAQFGKG